MSEPLAAATNRLRSIATGTNRVHQRLNAGRAMTVCWTTNSPSRAVLTSSEGASAPGVPESIPLGTPKFATNPMA